MKDLILIGGGGHCKSCIDVIESEGKYRIIGILDRAEKLGKSLLGHRYVGTDADIKHYVDAGAYFLITVGHLGNASIRVKLAKKLEENNAKLATVISSRAYLAKTACVAGGTIVMHDALVNSGARVGSHCIVNSKVLIEHDSVIKSLCHISTGAIINGGVEVGSGSFIGSNAVVTQGVNLCPESFVKAGRCFSGNQRKTKVAFLSTLFPVPERYVKDFLRSLSNQTYKKFDLILMNDGYGSTASLKEEFNELNIIEISSKGSIPKNREALIRFALDNGYDTAIFGDIDDYFTENRVQVSIEKLLSTDIVVNELSPFSEGVSPTHRIISDRLEDFSNNPIDFILDKNVFGLSNTAINLNKVSGDILCFPEDLIAVDWYFYSNLLLQEVDVTFTNQMVTYYRQHSDNTAGAPKISPEAIKNTVKVRLIHYFHMREKDNRYKRLYEKELSLSHSLDDTNILDSVVSRNQRELNSPLWWEVID